MSQGATVQHPVNASLTVLALVCFLVYAHAGQEGEPHYTSAGFFDPMFATSATVALGRN